MTKREDIHQVRRLINSINLDTRISNLFIHNKLVDVARLIIKREIQNNRRLFRSTNLFNTLNCVELESVDLINCTGLIIPNCKTIMRSVKPLPKSFINNLFSVYSIDRSTQFTQTTPSLFTNISKREFKGKIKYYWIMDDYLYIPDSFISSVTIDSIFINNSEVEKFNSPNSCFNFLDAESSLPEDLKMDIIRVTATEIAQITKRIPIDESPELNSNKLT